MVGSRTFCLPAKIDKLGKGPPAEVLSSIRFSLVKRVQLITKTRIRVIIKTKVKLVTKIRVQPILGIRKIIIRLIHESIKLADINYFYKKVFKYSIKLMTKIKY